MQRVLRNASGALRLHRGTYGRLLWDDYATADAVMIVAAVSIARLLAAVALGRFRALGLIQGLLQVTTQELIRWMVAALVLWVVATKLFKGVGRIPATVGVTGYAYLPFVFAPLVKLGLGLSGVAELSIFVDVLASFWFGLGLVVVGQVLFDLPRDKALMSAAVSVVGWWLVTLII